MSSQGPTSDAVSPDSGALWTEPGAWRVAPGVLRVPLPLPMDGLQAINVYVLEGAAADGDGLTCIDAGWAIAESRSRFESSLREAGYAVGDIRRFLVTHAHRDHYTQAVTIRREFGSHVTLGAAEASTVELCHDPPASDPHLQYLRQTGAPDLVAQWEAFTEHMSPEPDQWLPPDAWLDGDQRIDLGHCRLDAVHTPGHTKGHFVFRDDAAGLLYAGDHVLPTITPSIGVEPVLEPQPLGDFLSSLRKVRALPDSRLLPAHGPVAPSVHARVDELLVHHDHRLIQCLEALAAGQVTAREVAGVLPWTRRDRTFSELHVFDRVLAVLETRAHLEFLTAQGRATRSETGEGVYVYAPS